MELLKGKPAADKINERTAAVAQELLSKDIMPTLAILRVGSNPSDIAYEENAVKKAKSLGIHVEKYIMEREVRQKRLTVYSEKIQEKVLHSSSEVIKELVEKCSVQFFLFLLE